MYYLILSKKLSRSDINNLFASARVINEGFFMIGYDVKASVKKDYTLKYVNINPNTYFIRRCDPTITVVEFDIENPPENILFSQIQASTAPNAQDVQILMNRLASNIYTVDIGQTEKSLTYDEILLRLENKNYITKKSTVASTIVTQLFQLAEPQAVQQAIAPATSTIAENTSTQANTFTKYLPLIIIAILIVILIIFFRKR